MRVIKKTITLIISIVTAIICLAQIRAQTPQNILDQDITLEIRYRINNTSLSGETVATDTEDALSGTLTSFLSEERLINNTAKTIKGVRAVVDEIVVHMN